MTQLYLEAHLTLEPIKDHERAIVEEIARRHQFRLARLVMLKDAGPDQPSRRDSFMTAHGKQIDELAERAHACCRALRDAGFRLWRYKIESCAIDSRQTGDQWGVLDADRPELPLISCDGCGGGAITFHGVPPETRDENWIRSADGSETVRERPTPSQQYDVCWFEEAMQISPTPEEATVLHQTLRDLRARAVPGLSLERVELLATASRVYEMRVDPKPVSSHAIRCKRTGEAIAVSMDGGTCVCASRDQCVMDAPR